MHQNSTSHRVLAYLAVDGQPARARDIAKQLGCTYSNASVTLNNLAYSGSVTKPHRGQFQITDRGRAQLAAMSIPKGTEVDLRSDPVAEAVLLDLEDKGAVGRTFSEISAGSNGLYSLSEVRAAAKRLIHSRLASSDGQRVRITHDGALVLNEHFASME